MLNKLDDWFGAKDIDKMASSMWNRVSKLTGDFDVALPPSNGVFRKIGELGATVE